MRLNHFLFYLSVCLFSVVAQAMEGKRKIFTFKFKGDNSVFVALRVNNSYSMANEICGQQTPLCVQQSRGPSARQLNWQSLDIATRERLVQTVAHCTLSKNSRHELITLKPIATIDVTWFKQKPDGSLDGKRTIQFKPNLEKPLYFLITNDTVKQMRPRKTKSNK